MLRYLKHDQIDFSRWDACVENSRQRIVYGYSWYLDVVSPGWAGLVREEAGEYVAVMPLPEATRFGIRYLRQPFFAQQLGIFSVKPEEDPVPWLSFLRRQYPLISKYAGNTGNPDLRPLAGERLVIGQAFTHHLDLRPDYETIYRSYSPDRQLNLKRARRANLNIVESRDIRPLIQMFRSDAANRITGGAAESSYGLLERLFAKLLEKGLATLRYTQTTEGEWDAGCLFVVEGGKIIYLFNAASVAGRRRNGRSLLIDQVIRAYAGKPFVFDFESPAAVGSIIRVYQGFGSVPVPFFTLHYNNLPAPVRWVKRARQIFYQKLLPTFKSPPTPE